MEPVDPYEQGCFKNERPCAYLTTMMVMCADDDIKRRIWACECEDRMAASCIPTFEEERTIERCGCEFEDDDGMGVFICDRPKSHGGLHKSASWRRVGEKSNGT
jgi:hypothetical protein